MNNLVIHAVHHDMVINAIKRKILNASNLDFQTLRNFAGIDSNKHAELDRGRLTIHRQELLNQYLFSYGPMVDRQWSHVLPKTFDMLSDNKDEKVHIFDYGCGQGLATLLLLEKTAGLEGMIEDVTLIEPSQIAIQRAGQIIGCKLPDTNIHSINKELDDLDKNELKIDKDKMNIHLFSNIFDIDSFDQFEVFNKLLKEGGSHYVIAVSNDRDFKGGSPRLESLYNAIQHYEPDEGELFKLSHAHLGRFRDSRNMNHIYFFLKIEIEHYV